MRSFLITTTALLIASMAAAQTPRGTLLIVGGGPGHPDVAKRLVELGGGAKGKMLIFPMASSVSDGQASVDTYKKLGIAAEAVVLTHDAAMKADTAVLFRNVTAVWFPGGDQSKLTAALLGTPVEAAIRNRYYAGAVVGGTSAGAAVLSRIMITGDERRIGGKRPPRDSTLVNITIDRDNVVTTQGFGLIPGAIVDQHFLRRRRHNRLISLVLENPTLVGAGIDESTAVEVQPNGKWRVWGESVVVIYDARAGKTTPAGQVLGGTDMRMHVLPAGSTFDFAKGKASLQE
jgi:cyanophycinase